MEFPPHSLVALHVIGALLLPVPAIRGGDHSAETAVVLVPKAAVNQDDLLAKRKDEIRFAGEVSSMKAESVPKTVCDLADDYLRLRIFAPNPGHAVTALFWSQVVNHCPPTPVCSVSLESFYQGSPPCP